MERMWDSLDADAVDLRRQNLWRHLRVIETSEGPVIRVAEQDLVNFSSNDYLGLAASDFLTDALLEGVEKHGAGAGASRLVCGTHTAHIELERVLADFKGTESALTFSSGFATAMGVIPALMGPGDTILLDKLSHACLVDAARLSGATVRVFPHNHLVKLERLLSSAAGRVLVVTESIFSMDGDAAALADIVSLKDRHGAWLLLDEAHAVGVLGPDGRGLAAKLGLESRVNLQMGTLSKGLGLCGGYVAASKVVTEWLVNRARSFIYSTAPPPSIAAAATAAIGWVRSNAGANARKALHDRIAQLVGGLGLGASESAIVPLIVGEEKRAMDLSSELRDEGFLIPAIRYPTVARDSARLRVTLSASHTADQVDQLVAAIRGRHAFSGSHLASTPDAEERAAVHAAEAAREQH